MLLFNSLMSNILRLVMVILVTKLSLAKIMNAVYYLCFQLGIYFVIADKTILIIQCVNMHAVIFRCHNEH